MTTMTTARVDSQKCTTAEKVFSGGSLFQIGVRPVRACEHEGDSLPARRSGGIQIGIADGKYAFKPDFDKKFGEMDAEMAEMLDK